MKRQPRKYRPPEPHIRKTTTPRKLRTPVEVKKMVIPSYQQPIIFAVKPDVTLEKLAKRGKVKAINSSPVIKGLSADFDGVDDVLTSGEEILRAGERIAKLCEKNDEPLTTDFTHVKSEDINQEEDLEMKQKMGEQEALLAAGFEEVDNAPLPSLPVGSMIMAAVMGAGVASYPMIEKGISGAGIAKAVGAAVLSAGVELLVEAKIDAVGDNTAARYTSAAVVGGAIGGAVIGVEKMMDNRRNVPTPISYPMSEQPITDE